MKYFLLDYIMLDLLSDNEERPASRSPDEPVSSSPDSNSSEMEELIRSKRLSDNGSPMLDSRRVIVAASNGRTRCLSEPPKHFGIDEEEVSNEVLARNGKLLGFFVGKN